MDLLDEPVRTASTDLTIRQRTALVKRYDGWRHCGTIKQRQRAVHGFLLDPDHGRI